MRFAEIIIGEIERDRSLKVFNLLAESVGQPGQSAAVHPQGYGLFNLVSKSVALKQKRIILS